MQNDVQNELDLIINRISQFSDGATLHEIKEDNRLTLSRRTLQRRLAFLVKNHLVITEGMKRNLRYKIPISNLTLLHKDETYVPISPESNLIKLAVRQHIQVRKPVSYNYDFLNQYEPNVSHYLSHEVQEHLLAIGGISNEPKPAGTYAKGILNRLLIDLSWNSSRLEGNTYSLLETERLLEEGEIVDGKHAFEAQMILNHKAAIEFLVETAADIDFNRYTIFNLHALLANNLLVDSRACGHLRSIPVGIHKTVYYPIGIPQLIEEYFQKILDKAKKIQNPFEQSFFCMVHLPYLQPFEDVNKRVSRLAANIPFIKNNLSPLSFIDVPEQAYIDGILGVYELNQVDLLRDVFVWAYERSSARYSAVRKSIGEPDLFRLRYRNIISNIIIKVIQDRLDKKFADIFIKQQATLLVPEKDISRLIEIIEIELNALHEGNIARYRLSLPEFIAWQSVWLTK